MRRQALARGGLMLAATLLAWTTSVTAQVDSVTLVTGQVVDDDGQPVAGAVVVSDAGGTTSTRSDGTFRLEVAAGGAHDLTVTAAASDATGLRSASTTVRAPATSGGPAGQPVDTGSLILTATTGTPQWLPTFGGPGGRLDDKVFALAVFDDGSGPRLVAGGDFVFAGDVEVNHVAQWTGQAWAPIGPGFDGPVFTLTVAPTGGLVAGGDFQQSGFLITERIASWDGALWRPLSIHGGLDSDVFATAFFDEGNGPKLFVAGYFLTAGGVAAPGVARFDGPGWSALNGSLNGYARALHVWDDGNGPGLYVGGSFDTAGTVFPRNVARWDGAAWSKLGGGLNNTVFEFAQFDEGNGPVLFAGGDFSQRIQRWNGSSWSLVNPGLAQTVRSLTVYDGALYAGGIFDGSVARWDGVDWTDFGDTLQSDTFAMTVFDFEDGRGPVLVSAAEFLTDDNARLMTYDEDSWAPLGSSIDGDIQDFEVWEGELVAAGNLVTLDDFDAGVVRWTGTQWKSLAGVPAPVYALEVFDHGLGPRLYAGGNQYTSDGLYCWDGEAWFIPANTPSDIVNCLEVFDDGGGTALYAGGEFYSAGGVTLNLIGRFDGTDWTPLADGLGSFVFARVYDLAVFDDGNGPALYAAGRFTKIWGAPVDFIGRWDGVAWNPLGTGLDDYCTDLAVFDDGNGPALYVSGFFTTAGDRPAGRLARWDGTDWSDVGADLLPSTITAITSMTAHDDGTGSALYVSGTFTEIGGVPAERIARWDGSTWSALGSGMDDTVVALFSFDDGSGTGPALFAGGRFTQDNDAGDEVVAKWGCPPPPPVWVDLGGGTAGIAGIPELAMDGPLTPASAIDLGLVGGAPSSLALLFVSFSSSPTGFLGGTLHAFPFDELVVLATDGAGEIHGAGFFPGAASGQGLWFQVGIADASVPVYGASLSAAVVGTVP